MFSGNKVLDFLFPRNQPLQDWLVGGNFNLTLDRLVLPQDGEGYRELLRTTRVAAYDATLFDLSDTNNEAVDAEKEISAVLPFFCRKCMSTAAVAQAVNASKRNVNTAKGLRFGFKRTDGPVRAIGSCEAHK
jgi:hypothetical protein